MGGWGSLVCEDNSFGGRITLILNLCCLAAILPNGRTWGTNPKEKSEAGALKAVRSFLKLRSGSFCNLWQPCCFFTLASDVERRVMLHGQQPFLHIINAKVYIRTSSLWREQSSFAFCVDTTPGAADTGYKLSLNWCRAKHQAFLSTLWEIFRSHWSVPPVISWAAPSQLGAVSPLSAFLIVCKGNRGQPNSRLQSLYTRQQKTETKRPASKLGCWNIRTLLNGLFTNLQDIRDTWKTTIINGELKRVSLDINTTLQETWLDGCGTLKEKHYTFYRQKRSSNQPRV